MGEEQQRSRLEGVLERVVYANEESAWSVVRLTVQGRRDPVTAVGNLLGVQPGENLKLSGRWVLDRRFGEQFRVETFETLKPATLVGIEKYLGSGMVRGLGPVMARRLVEQFGAATLEIIDRQPERLSEVEGIGAVRIASIRKAWVEQREIRELMVLLQSLGVSPVFAARLYNAYRDDATAVVREDPYRLALEIFGIGFKTADRIALGMGIPRHSIRRAQAGLLHALEESSTDGHVYLPRPRLVSEASKLLEVEGAIVEQALTELAPTRQVILERLTEDAGEEEAVFLPALHTAEIGVTARMQALLSATLNPIQIDVDRALEWFEARRRLELAEEQRQAVRDAMRSKVLVITGGPGTGKTTLINAIVQILEKKDRRILLAAPTGRAARRLAELTGRDAKTVHRLLEFTPRTGAFERNPARPLEVDLLIVDEVSMVDLVLFHHILKALPAHSQLILVGDVDQLPSVGPGNILRDLIRCGAVDVVRLTQIFRQAKESLIVVNAHRINRGEMPLMGGRDGKPDFLFVEKEEPEEVLEEVKRLVSSDLPREYGLDPVDEIQVLTPMHRGEVGATNLNAELGVLLNRRTEQVSRGDRTLRLGDRVMQIRNNYQIDVFNGDIGRIEALDPENRQVHVRFDDRTIAYDTADLDELVLAYACSIHKAQGSEYPCVVIPLHTQHFVMLQRNLLYTALTRGKRLVVIVGSRKALALAVQNNRIEERYSRLAQRMAPLAAGGG
ncbi:MAG TPA: ATP-dependent RecD-like DNA helicase [Candidatus Polarisedimenticolia bacterium]|jgi:exodeoxyribonuclease V alpha subunit|nr:ATP-dependent RecD-like DNA helicase [Candidatus Polarisedimenticolia bacterium]